MQINTNRLNKIRYTIYAPIYDIVAKILNKSRKKAIQLLDIKPNSKVLIIGAGTGLDLIYIPNNCEITATDITKAMLNQTSILNKKYNHNLKIMIMDGQQLDFENETFDYIILHLILAVIPNPIKTIEEAKRVLKQEGEISVYDKFVPKHKKISLLRKAFNPVTNLLFSNITLSFENINANTKLKVVNDIKADLGGTFRILTLKK